MIMGKGVVFLEVGTMVFFPSSTYLTWVIPGVREGGTDCPGVAVPGLYANLHGQLRRARTTTRFLALRHFDTSTLSRIHQFPILPN